MKTTLFTHVTVAFSCCLATFTACAGPETEIDPIGNAPVTISASISGEVITKADNNYQPAEGNKKIFLYYKDGSNVKAHEKGVYSYSGSWTAELSGNSIFWDDLEDVNGEYPFFAVSPTDLDKATTGSIVQNQSANADFANSDLLMAFSEVAAQKAKVPLIFKHMLAKLTVKVKVGTITNFTSSTVTIQNAKKEFTVNYTSPAPTAAVPATVVVKSDATTTELTPHSEADDSYEDNGVKTIKVYSIILPAQEISNSGAKVKTTITAGTATNVYTYAPVIPVSLANGTHTTLTLTVKGTGVELDDVKVTDWTTAAADGNITIDTP